MCMRTLDLDDWQLHNYGSISWSELATTGSNSGGDD